MEQEREVTIDWSQAEVADGELTVPLSDKPPKGWKDGFERTAQLLGESRWREVSVKKSAIHVRGVEPGSEEPLRFYLEGLVEQANADVRPDPPAEGGRGSGDGDGSEDSGPDAEMTGRFRGFAKDEGEDSGGEKQAGADR